MIYFTALGITTAITGAVFLFFILAFPIEVISGYFTPVVQVVFVALCSVTYIASLKRLSNRSSGAQVH